MVEREAGERARSVLRVATEVAVTMPGRPVPQLLCRHVVLDDGSLLLGGPLLPAITAAALGDGVPRVRSTAGSAVLVEAADVCPVRDRIRARVLLAEHGRGRTDARPVPWSDYVASSPDPLLGVEAAMLTHLSAQRPRELWHLALPSSRNCGLAQPSLVIR